MTRKEIMQSKSSLLRRIRSEVSGAERAWIDEALEMRRKSVPGQHIKPGKPRDMKHGKKHGSAMSSFPIYHDSYRHCRTYNSPSGEPVVINSKPKPVPKQKLIKKQAEINYLLNRELESRNPVEQLPEEEAKYVFRKRETGMGHIKVRSGTYIEKQQYMGRMSRNPKYNRGKK